MPLELIQAMVWARRHKEDRWFALVRPIGDSDAIDGLQCRLQGGAEHCDVCRRSSEGSTAEDWTKRHRVNRNLVFQCRRPLVAWVEDSLERGVGGTLHRALRGVSNHHIRLTVREGNLTRKTEIRKQGKKKCYLTHDVAEELKHPPDCRGVWPLIAAPKHRGSRSPGIILAEMQGPQEVSRVLEVAPEKVLGMKNAGSTERHAEKCRKSALQQRLDPQDLRSCTESPKWRLGHGTHNSQKLLEQGPKKAPHGKEVAGEEGKEKLHQVPSVWLLCDTFKPGHSMWHN